ncbi:hypothetical protein B7P43_G04436 [Cryptotermes secundus]|uniref:Uncharacterized protein n=1 Tax=Cryptotermes secundus TaxID=105785 RepID=A0A2J7QJV3_9NEOP|nr:hypothetical protein B7P43_G04436 [Cryptotermes secundus]
MDEVVSLIEAGKEDRILIALDIHTKHRLVRFFFVGFEVLIVMTMKNTVFWDVTLCNQVYQTPIAACFLLVSCLACFSTLKKALYSSETLLHFYWTTQGYIPEYSTRIIQFMV